MVKNCYFAVAKREFLKKSFSTKNCVLRGRFFFDPRVD